MRLLVAAFLLAGLAAAQISESSAREENVSAPYRGCGTAPCPSGGSEAGVPRTAAPEPQSPAAKPAHRSELTPEQRRQLEARLSQLQAAVVAAPEEPELWRHLGLTHQALGDAVGAKGAFEKVVALRPADAAGHFMLALALEKLQDPRAVAEWELCLRHATDPGMTEAANRHLKHLRGG